MREQDLTPEALELIAARLRVLSEPLRPRRAARGGAGERLQAPRRAARGRHRGPLQGGAQRLSHSIANGTIFRLFELVCSSIDDRLAAQRSAVIGYSKR
jgi:hypothetical protein